MKYKPSSNKAEEEDLVLSISKQFNIEEVKRQLQHKANILNANGESFKHILVLLKIIDYLVQSLESDPRNNSDYINHFDALISIVNISLLGGFLGVDQLAASFLMNNPYLVNQYQSSIMLDKQTPSLISKFFGCFSFAVKVAPDMSGGDSYIMRKYFDGNDDEGMF